MESSPSQYYKINRILIPNSGICRDVMGIFSEMLSWNTVSESKTVTPRNIVMHINIDAVCFATLNLI